MTSNVVDFGMADADLIRKIELLGHRETAQVIAEAGAVFSNRTWLDNRIRRGLAQMARYDEPDA